MTDTKPKWLNEREFHELCMDYRGASPMLANDCYIRLQEFIASQLERGLAAIKSQPVPINAEGQDNAGESPAGQQIDGKQAELPASSAPHSQPVPVEPAIVQQIKRDVPMTWTSARDKTLVDYIDSLQSALQRCKHNSGVTMDELGEMRDALQVAQQERDGWKRERYQQFARAELAVSRKNEAEAALQEAQQEKDYWRGMYNDKFTDAEKAEAERDKCAMMNDDQSRRVYAEEERNKRLVELLKIAVKLMKHGEHCEAGYDMNAHECDCGYDELLREAGHVDK